MDRKGTDEGRTPFDKIGDPLHEIVYYKIGGTVYEVETSCGGTESLYDKIVRLLKSEMFAKAADKDKMVRYNSGSNLFVGRSLQEE